LQIQTPSKVGIQHPSFQPWGGSERLRGFFESIDKEDRELLIRWRNVNSGYIDTSQPPENRTDPSLLIIAESSSLRIVSIIKLFEASIAEIDVRAVAFTSDDSKLVTVTRSGGFQVWDVQTGELISIHEVEDSTRIDSVSLSANATRVLCTSSRSCKDDDTKTSWTVEVWDSLNRALLFTHKGTGILNRLTTATSGSTAAAVLSDNRLQLWDLATGEDIGALNFDDYISALALADDGHTCVVGTNDGQVSVLRVANG